MTTLLLIGGGHAHIEVLRRFAETPVPTVRIVVVTPDSHSPYSGMLPGLLAGHYTWDACHIDVASLAARAGALFVRGRVHHLDVEDRRVHVEHTDPAAPAASRSIAFDCVSLDVGSVPDTAAVPGAREHAVPVKPVDGFLDAWQTFVGKRGTSSSPPRILVVGGGAGGVEIAMALDYRRRQEPTLRGLAEARVTILSSNALDGHRLLARHLVARALDNRGIAVRRGECTGVEADGVRSADGTHLGADFIAWVTRPSAHDWIRTSGLSTDARGFMAVGDDLRSISHPWVFGAGDAVSLVGRHLPKAGVFAVREAGPLETNLRRHLAGASLMPYRPQSVWLSILALGDRDAIATYGGLAWRGRWVWRWKDRIDRAFMARYRANGGGSERSL